MKIAGALLYNNIQNNFRGKKLYHTLKKDLLPQRQVINITSTMEDDEKYIGSLPKEWIEKFREGSIKENTEYVLKTFAQFAANSSATPLQHAFTCKYYNTGLYENLKDKDGRFYLEPAQLWSRNISKLEESLKKAFNADCKVTYITDASYGIVFKVQIGDKSCALKTYLPEGGGKSGDSMKSHGAFSEIANAVCLNNSLKPSQCSKFYCAKIPSPNRNDAFMLTDFKESKGSKGARQREDWFSRDTLYWGKYSFEDAHRDNFIDGALVDFGAVEYTFSSLKTAKMAREFFPMIQRGDIEGITEFKQKHEKSIEFKECMDYLKQYMGTYEDLENLENFAYHCYTRKLTKKIINSFRALGADYSKFENADFSSLEYDKYREKLEELFK